MAQPKYQVFISSTYEDLKVERDAVVKTILEMGHIPVGMEMFSAADEEQWEIIARHIAESDFYLVVLAHKYGSELSDGMSYTRKEYEHAASVKIPILGFPIKESAAWPGDRRETDAGKLERLSDFRSLVMSRPVNFWESASDLCGKVAISLNKAILNSSTGGWIPASQGVDPSMAKELGRLSEENASLRKELLAIKGQDKADVEAEMGQLKSILDLNRKDFNYRKEPNGVWLDANKTLSEVFLVLAPSLQIEESLGEIASILAMHCLEDGETTWDVVAINQVEDVLATLAVLDLVEPSTRRHSVQDTTKYWTITDKGRAMYKYISRQNLREGISLPTSTPELLAALLEAVGKSRNKRDSSG